ncbi:MAG TPA: type II toxin-antitoxin system RatA family toxin, partial [Pinirhizobacter sp.]|nr:type II toxin-antitoxin system RatA family toxin [Pinirhizobacter sp.]
MTEIRRSALVPYTPAQMFDLVNDVEAYPKRFG